MIKCLVCEVHEFNTYILKSGDQQYDVMLEFYGIEKLKEGDVVVLHELLLDQNSKLYTRPYAFEKVDGFNPNNIINKNDTEFIVVGVDKKTIYTMKRIYG